MGKVKKFFSDFKKFISRGNIVDMAIGVIVASAFTAIVTAFTDGIIMPLVNALIAVCGGGDIESAYTILIYGDDLASSIYIDWGAFISSILDFLIIAFVLFTLLKVVMGSQNAVKKAKSDYPTKAERKELKAQGVNMKNHAEVIEATKALREKNKPAEAPKKPTQEELLTEILAELKKQNAEPEKVEEVKEVEAPKVETKKKTVKTEK